MNHMPVDEPVSYDDSGNIVLIGPIGPTVPGMGQSSITYSTLANGMPILSSRPTGASGAMFLDFDGDPTLNPNGVSSAPYDLDGNNTTFNAAEQANIVETWRKAALYYSMFDINVTTVQPDVVNVPTCWQVISSSWASGGVAYVGAYGSTVARAWSSVASAASGVQTTQAHESGHVMGLQHQSSYDLLGNQISEYRNAVDPAHGAIIGNGGGQINKWVFGLISSSVTTQDDVQVIANKIKNGAKPGYTGDGFATDDFGNTIATASALPVVSSSSQATTGVIERVSDSDVFSFTSNGGAYSIAVVRDYPSGLDAKISIYDSSGNLIAAQDGNPTDFTQRLSNDQYITLELGAGNYYVKIESHAGYGDLGTYLVSANVLPSGWQSQSLGSNAIPGFSSYNATTGMFTIAGGGTDITATSGGHQFAYQTLSGDGSIIARVATLNGQTALAKAGLMIRDVFTTGSRFVSLSMTSDRGPALLSRATLNGSVTSTVAATSIPFVATWLKLTRIGNLFTAFTSSDGVNWGQYGASVSIALSPTAYIGLMASGAVSPALTTATLDGVALTGTLNPTSTLNALQAPTNITLSNVAATTATVGWSLVSGATGYSIERSSDGVNYTVLAAVGSAVTSYNSTGMWDGDRFFYRVRASNAAGVSVPSDVVVATTLPGATTGVTVAAVSSSQLVVSWNDVDTESNYRIERSIDQSNWTLVATVAANITVYADSGLTTNSRYYYRIVTIVNGTDVATSTTTSGSTRINGIVTGLVISDVMTTSVSLAWNAFLQADGYRIDRSTDGTNYSTIANLSGGTIGYVDTGRTAFTKYYYRVYGVNSATGSLTATAQTFASTLSTSPPSSPWLFKEFGGLPGTGTAQESAGTFTVVTSGTGIGSTLDRGGMLYQNLSGDVAITARVASIGSNLTFTGTAASNAAGIMIREDLGDASKFIYARRTNANTIGLEYRTGTGVASITVGSISSSNAWLRITRTGNSFLAEYSSSGSTWTAFATIVLAMAKQVYVGLAAESDTAALLTNSSFVNVSVTGSYSSFDAAPRGTGTQANTTTLGGQFAPTVAADANGNFVVAWADEAGGVYARRYNSAGTALGAQFRVDSRAGETASAPTVAVDATGNFVIAWTGSSGADSNISAQRYDATGAPVGTQTTTVNTTTNGLQSSPMIVMTVNGFYAIAWVSAGQDGDGDGLYLQRFTNTGVKSGSETLVNIATTGSQNDPQMAIDSAGNYVVVWTDSAQDGSQGGIVAKRYASSGAVQTSDYLVNQTFTGDQSAPSVAAAGNGTYLIAWNAYLQDGSGYGIVARLYSATGTPLTNEFVVNQYTTGNQLAPSVAVDSVGNFIIAWQSAGQDGSGWGVYGRRYDVTGNPLTREFRIHTQTTDDQTAPAAALSAYGTGVVVWQSNNEDGSGQGIFFRVLGNNENPTTSGPTAVTTPHNTAASVNLFNLFADSSDSDDFLVYAVVGNTNPSLIAQTAFDSATGFLSITPTLDTYGSTILTIRAADAAGLFVETTVTVNVQIGALTPIVTGATTAEDVMTTGGLVISRNAANGNEVTHFKITAINSGVLYQSDGATVIHNGDFITAAQGSAGLKFMPAANFNGTATFAVQASLSNSDSGLGGSTVVVQITVTAVNDAPLHTMPVSQIVNSGGLLTLSVGNGNAIIVGDVDAGNGSLRTTLTAAGGKLTLATVAGLSFSVGSGTNDVTATFTGTLAAINTALDGLKYVPNAGFSGAGSIRIQTDDQGNSGGNALGDDDTITINVNAAPKITGVYVRGTGTGANNWAAAFTTYLANNGQGSVTDSTLGYKLSNGANQLRSLPWLNVNTVNIQFNEAVTIGKSDLTLIGSVNGPALPSVAGSTFRWNSSTLVATWTFASSFPREKVLLHLGNTVLDSGGAVLDGDWTSFSSTTSGNGLGGGDFNFRFNTLPGDFNFNNSVTFGEIGLAQTHVGKNTASAGYNYREDFNASGSMTFGEIGQAQAYVGGGLAVLNEPIVPGGGPLATSVAAPLPTFDSNGEGYAVPFATLTPEQLAPIVTEAELRWQASHLWPGLIDWSVLQFTIGDLGPNYLGLFTPEHTIQLDDDGAGWGWFIDASPASNDEFLSTDEAQVFTAAAGNSAGGRMDLLSAVMHEIGHFLGFDGDHVPERAVAVMSEDLETGIRRTLLPPPPPTICIASVNETDFTSVVAEELLPLDMPPVVEPVVIDAPIPTDSTMLAKVIEETAPPTFDVASVVTTAPVVVASCVVIVKLVGESPSSLQPSVVEPVVTDRPPVVIEPSVAIRTDPAIVPVTPPRVVVVAPAISTAPPPSVVGVLPPATMKPIFPPAVASSTTAASSHPTTKSNGTTTKPPSLHPQLLPSMHPQSTPKPLRTSNPTAIKPVATTRPPAISKPATPHKPTASIVVKLLVPVKSTKPTSSSDRGPTVARLPRHVFERVLAGWDDATSSSMSPVTHRK
jgi:regulation of enolase protein 1 (concanavalin A-like superfamily)